MANFLEFFFQKSRFWIRQPPPFSFWSPGGENSPQKKNPGWLL